MPGIKFEGFMEDCNQSIYQVEDQASDIVGEMIKILKQKYSTQIERSRTLGSDLSQLKNYLPKTSKDFKVFADLMYAIYKKYKKVYYMTSCKNCIWHAIKKGMRYEFSVEDDQRIVTLIYSGERTDYIFTKVPLKGPERGYSAITDVEPFLAEFNALLKHIGCKAEITVS